MYMYDENYIYEDEEEDMEEGGGNKLSATFEKDIM